MQPRPRFQHQGAPPPHQWRSPNTLYAFISTVARDCGITVLAIGGTDDHIHILLSLPATITLAKAMQTLKGVSSKWIHDTFSEKKSFAWQEGYGAFSVSISQIPKTAAYINNQQQHHKKQSFEEEFVLFLKRHGIEYDPRFVLG
ncbi:MAG: IS200/IS605 family transposase [Terriglobales bacterium]